MTPQQFKRFAIEYTREHGLYDAPGCLLYSAGRTVCEGKYLVLGYNPGGEESATVGDSLRRFDTEHNCYLDEQWAPGGVVHARGAAPFQAQVRAIFDAVGVSLRDVCAANVVFARSRREHGLASSGALEAVCWPVVEQLISAVNPGSILCINRNTTSVVMNRLGSFSLSDEIPAEHSNWQCRLYERETEPAVRLVEVPGLGVYKKISSRKVPHVVAWIAGALRGDGL